MFRDYSRRFWIKLRTFLSRSMKPILNAALCLVKNFNPARAVILFLTCDNDVSHTAFLASYKEENNINLKKRAHFLALNLGFIAIVTSKRLTLGHLWNYISLFFQRFSSTSCIFLSDKEKIKPKTTMFLKLMLQLFSYGPFFQMYVDWNVAKMHLFWKSHTTLLQFQEPCPTSKGIFENLDIHSILLNQVVKTLSY